MNTKNKIKFTISSNKKSENYVITKEDSLGFHHSMFVTVPELKVLSVKLSKMEINNVVKDLEPLIIA